ncbi:hypothetical protein TorRG33x02_223600 [Trema orientale]|uniref:Uncharacterized protein n=1 Tax=Trema orientale TaxID=63057 RepID=A0A2P5E8K3_TREOI|nr:hypothetical protein TorRG33x02_223600 [Trema orientale]
MAAKMVLKDAATKGPLLFLRGSLLAAARSATVPSVIGEFSQKPPRESAALRRYIYGVDSVKLQGSVAGYRHSAFGVEARGSSRKVVKDEDDDEDDDDDDDDDDDEDFSGDDVFDDTHEDGVDFGSDSDSDSCSDDDGDEYREYTKRK